ncbi:mannan endo-1,4-beta-mannosidase 4-like isoform X2 [Mangifera indica]|uniref:mannan endo-1,4-beta-mannosidase 4-like isoform X2 n=1 Tax=Mangifera indica TaxID=29780 RepID=UPI001CF94D9A|nr:mannan endo-1,4-beta-mannosidase 4-like isoform X2 [Mangifera indica]
MLGARCFNCSILLALTLMITIFQIANCQNGNNSNLPSFARVNGCHFVMNGKRLYLNGFNAYWMMFLAADPSTRVKVTSTFQQASKYCMNIARIWAFSDGGATPLQSSPGSYNEDMFKGLDFVISEAKKYGVYLILSLVNNFEDYGGRPQYVQWARERGQSLKNDDFYTNLVVKQYYKNHAVLTRKNSFTGVMYKDDTTIFSWELMNEARCGSDPSGKKLQQWITEMSAYVKSIDNLHLLEIGLEGFYGESVKSRKQYNPNNVTVGTDFIANNQIPQIDFTTVHMYPEHWLKPNSTDGAQQAFVDRWIQAHTEDCNSVLKKPLIITEFGKSDRLPGYSIEKRNNYLGHVYNAIFISAKAGGSFLGGIFWQLMTQGMENYADGYQVILEESPTTAKVIAEQSRKLHSLSPMK